MTPVISPSILAADFGNLASEIRFLEESGADWVHLDVMDGHFVPNISFGLPVIEAIRKITDLPLDVHLMIEYPDHYLQDFHRVGADIITVHWEACTHLHRTIRSIKSLGCKAGVAVNPHIPVEFLQDILPELDLVNLMSVNPGFGGQQFITGTLDKIRRLKKLVKEQGLSPYIEVDGGVNLENAGEIVQAGADTLVAGSFVFKSADREEKLKALKNIE